MVLGYFRHVPEFKGLRWINSEPLAIKELKRSIEIDNNFLYSHESLAIIYFNQERLNDARSEAEFILDREPDNKTAKEILRKILD